MIPLKYDALYSNIQDFEINCRYLIQGGIMILGSISFVAAINLDWIYKGYFNSEANTQSINDKSIKELRYLCIFGTICMCI